MLTLAAVRALSEMPLEGIRLTCQVSRALRQVPALFKVVPWVTGTINLDLGGGPWDEGTEYLSVRGVENLVYDPCARSREHNARVLDRLVASPAGTVTLANVLNVIPGAQERAKVLAFARAAIRPGGIAYISVYPGNKSGRAHRTHFASQNNRPLDWYTGEVRQFFPRVLRRVANGVEHLVAWSPA